jgi:U4/U6 small nuclear ribonucleoprotein PRP3
MEKRQKAHEERNLARKLSPEERKAKKLKKIQEDLKSQPTAALFKLTELTHPKLRFKARQ